jgi:long-chain acyl-CoA synthetase
MSDPIWLQQYGAGVPEQIDPDRYASLVELLRQRCETTPDAPAFTNQGTTLSYREVDALSRRFAAYLRRTAGLAGGDRVAVMMPNLLQTPIAVFGILRAGLVVVNVNPQYTARELEHQLRDSGAKAIIVLENFVGTLAQALAATAVGTVIVTSVGDQHAWPKRWLIDFVVRHVKKLVPKTSVGGAVRYRAVLRAEADAGFEDAPLTHDDVAFLQYTGGTTGVAKGAVLTHGNLVSNVMQLTAWVGPMFDPREGVVVTALPLYHIFALTVNLFCFVELGGHNLLITDPRDLKSVIAALGRQPFTFVTGVNTLFNALLHAPGFDALDFGALRATLAGGMAVQRDVAERWHKLTGCVIAQGYGLTEASPVVSANPLDVKTFNGSVGLPLPSTSVRIVGDDGAVLGIDEVGEICVSGPQVMRGYWQRPEETSKVIGADGWLRTGDIGRIDRLGFLFIEDRKKDMIVVSGFKVFPNEVEDVLMLHPGILEAAAVGIPDEESGERVKLFVVRKDPSLTEADVAAYCRENLTGYKRPRVIEFRRELPKSNVGKILRRELRDSQ